MYLVNKKVTNQVIDAIIANKIIRFHSQNSLYLLIENIKFPGSQNWRKRRAANGIRSEKQLYNQPRNYWPVVNYLLNAGALTKLKGKTDYSSIVHEVTMSREDLATLKFKI